MGGRMNRAASETSGLGLWRWWLASLFCLPVVFPYRWLPLLNFYQEVIAFALAALAAAVAAIQGLRTKSPSAAVSLGALVPVALLLVLTVQQLSGMIPYFQHFVLAAGALALAAFVVTLSHRKFAGTPEEVIKVIAWSILAAALANSAWCVVQLLGYELKGFALIERSPGHFRVGGFLGQPNQLSVLLVWALMCVLFLSLANHITRPAALVLSIVLLLVLALCGSRSTYVYLLVVGPLLSYLLKRCRCPLWRSPLGVALAYPLIDIVVRVVLHATGDSALAAAARPLDSASMVARLAFARDGFFLFLSSPLLGVGWRQFIVARWEMSEATMIELNADHAHNIVVNVLAELGAVGAVILFGGALLWLVRATAVQLTHVRSVLLCMIAVVGLYSLFEFPLWLGHFLLPTAVLVGLLETRALSFSISGSIRALRTAVAIACCAVVALLPLDYRRVESVFQYYFGAPSASMPFTLNDVLRLTNASLYRLQAEQAYLLTAPPDAFQAMFADDMSRRVFQRHPTPEFAVVRVAHLLHQGRHDEARHVLLRTCAWRAGSCASMRQRLEALGEEQGEPFRSFLREGVDLQEAAR